MSYTAHNFLPGDVLFSEQLNTMDAQIALNAQEIETLKNSSSSSGGTGGTTGGNTGESSGSSTVDMETLMPAIMTELKDNQSNVVFQYQRALNRTYDLNDIIVNGIYRYTASNRPLNAPTNYASIVLVIGYGSPEVGQYLHQIVINSQNEIFTRNGNGSKGWESWEQLAKYGDLKSWGVANIMARAEHMYKLVWTPVNSMPVTVDNYTHSEPVKYFKKQEQQGIPYSSVRDYDKAVGMDVSIHTFMTAVHDPKSVLYTRLSTVSNSAPYYGTVCSGLVNYALGIELDLTNDFLAKSDMFETISLQSIEAGDIIWVQGHVALIYSVRKDIYGRIRFVAVVEGARPKARAINYETWESFLAKRGNYIARRYKKRDEVPYKSIPYVQCFEEEAPEIIYPDVQTDHGDAAVFMKGETVQVNVIDDTGYTTITVKRDNTTILTTNTIKSFPISNVSGGLYTITATGPSKESVSTFYVIDATASFDIYTGDVTFSSTNARPVMVGVYCLGSGQDEEVLEEEDEQSSSGNQSVEDNRKVLVKDIILSDEQITAGQINVSSYIDIEAGYKYVKVWFKAPENIGPWGTAVWYSETESRDKWVSFTPPDEIPASLEV